MEREAPAQPVDKDDRIRILEFQVDQLRRELEALEYLQRARAIAPCPALIAAVEVDLAAYHRLRGDRVTARDHLELSRRHLGKTRWTEVNADQRMTLLEFAIEAFSKVKSELGI